MIQKGTRTMRPRALFLVLIISAAVTAQLAADTQTPDIREITLAWEHVAIEDGKRLYAELCAACHGSSAAGDGPATPALATPAPDLTRLAAQSGDGFPEARVKRAISGPDPRVHRVVSSQFRADKPLVMPEWEALLRDVRPDWTSHRRRSFATSRIEALTDYLRTIQEESAMHETGGR